MTAPRASIGGSAAQLSGLSLRSELFMAPAGSNTAAGWPTMAARFGAAGPGPFAFVARPGGASGFGGTSSFGNQPQLTWVEGGYRGYSINVPLKFTSAAGEWLNSADELFVISAMLRWETVAAPAAGADSGFFVAAWTANVAGSIPNATAGASATARQFGIYRQAVTGAFGFVGVQGNTVVHTPLTHPAGDVRIPIKVEYRIRNAKNGTGARLEVYLNDNFVLSASFAAGNALGLPVNYSGAAEQTLIPIASAGNAERVWCGSWFFSSGPDEAGSLG